MRLLLDKITFIDNIVICFNCVDKIVYRERTCYFVDACVCKSKNKSTTAIIIVHCISSPNVSSCVFCLLKYFCS